MFRNYLRIAFRNLWRSKGFSALNLTGLAIGMASATLILLWIHNEWSFDKFHRNNATLYKVWNRGIVNGSLECWDNTARPLGPVLRQEYPAITNMTRVDNRWVVTQSGDVKMSSHVNVVDSTFLELFSFPLVKGNPATALLNPNSMVVTEAMAKKLFGAADAMNRTVTIDKIAYTVTGVLKDLPPSSSLDFEFLLPWRFESTRGEDVEGWGNYSVSTYVRLSPTADAEALGGQIKKTVIRHAKGKETAEIFLHPLRYWHLYNQFDNGHLAGGRITIVRLFAVIAGFILLIACINFMNLSTAKSERRAREVGIRKVAGASRGLLIAQFIGESLLMATLSGVVALSLVQLSLPYFDLLIGKPLTLPYGSPLFWGLALLFVAFTGGLAGSYPAFFLSSFKPVAVLKGSFKRAHAVINPRKVLVVLQFSFAILLIICTMVVVRQIGYAQDRLAGYDRGRILYHWTTGDINDRYPAIRQAILATGLATDVTRSGSPLTMIFSDTWNLQWAGKPTDDKTDFDRFSEDEGLVKTAGLTLVAGRDMNLVQYPTDSTAMLLNETAATAMGLKQTIGATITDGPISFHVIGVVKDFITGSPYEKISPMVIEGTKSNFFNSVNIRLADGVPAATVVDRLRTIFQQYNPSYPFEPHFANEDYQRQFDDNQRIATLTGLFAGLTIFISCLGLFGLAAYMAENRIREIGVRKVLGASVWSITRLLTREFLSLVMLALVIASPIAWFIMHGWLQGYAYRVPLGAGVFLFAGAGSLLISLLTVGWQAIAAARANPVKSLRTGQ